MTIAKALENFNSQLITKNNCEDEDAGVHQMLLALHSDNPQKAMKDDKTLRKEELMAGLGFLNNLTFTDAKKEYTKIKVDDLINKIVETYSLMTPDLCLKCNKIYEAFNNDLGKKCFICTKRMCSDCVPDDNDDSAMDKVVFAICKGCVEAKTGQTINPEPIISNSEPFVLSSPKEKSSQSTNNSSKIATENGYEKFLRVCKFFLQKRCRHVKNGTTCNFSHPKICFGWTKQGKCKDKNKCSVFYHPELCPKSSEGIKCDNIRCEFYHLPKTAPNYDPDRQNRKQTRPMDSSNKSPNFQKELLKDPQKESQLMDLLNKLVNQVDILTKESLERKKLEPRNVLQWNPISTQ